MANQACFNLQKKLIELKCKFIFLFVGNANEEHELKFIKVNNFQYSIFLSCSIIYFILVLEL